MNRTGEWFRRLRAVAQSADFRAAIEEAVERWNFETAAAFDRFWGCAAFEQRLEMVRGLRRLDPSLGQSAVALLCIWAYTRDRALKLEILETLDLLPSTPALWRLWAVYKRSTHRETRLRCLGIFTRLACGLFLKEALADYGAEEPAVREALLGWAARVPILDEGERKALGEALRLQVAELTPPEAEGFFRRHHPLLTRHGISLARLFRRFLKDEPKAQASGKATTTEEAYGSEREPERMRAPFSADIIAELVTGWDRRRSRVRPARFWENFQNPHFDPDFGAWDPILRQHASIWATAHLSEWSKSSNLTLAHIALDRLRGFDQDVFEVFSLAVTGEGTFAFKQGVLDHLLFWRIPEERRAGFHASLKALLSDGEHVRIFTSLARILSLQFGEEGMRDLLGAFERHGDPGHKTALLRGLVHALREDGALTRLTPASRELISRMASNVAATLRGAKRGETALFDHWCRLVALLRLEECEGELLAQLKGGPVERSALAALVALDSQASMEVVAAWLVQARANPREEWEKVVKLFSDLCETRPRQAASLSDAVLEPWLSDPEYSADVIRYLASTQRPSFRARIAKLVVGESLLTRLWALEYLAQFPPETFLPETVAAFRSTREPLLCDRAAKLLAPAADDGLLGEIMDYFINERGEVRPLGEFLASLEEHPGVLERVLHKMLQHRGHPRFGHFYPLLRFFLLSRDDGATVLPLDEVLKLAIPSSPGPGDRSQGKGGPRA
ncbi:MAG: hypothetical protein J0L75_01495 [Spirochaetes bacterium]|nr:hypothetical protein [Spirochaetota bacterium]